MNGLCKDNKVIFHLLPLNIYKKIQFFKELIHNKNRKILVLYAALMNGLCKEGRVP
jgi:hypothetical protein